MVLDRERLEIQSPVMKIGEAARYLGVGRKILYQLIEMGRIRAFKRQGTTVVEKQSLDDFRAGGKLT